MALPPRRTARERAEVTLGQETPWFGEACSGLEGEVEAGLYVELVIWAERGRSPEAWELAVAIAAKAAAAGSRVLLLVASGRGGLDKLYRLPLTTFTDIGLIGRNYRIQHDDYKGLLQERAQPISQSINQTISFAINVQSIRFV